MAAWAEVLGNEPRCRCCPFCFRSRMVIHVTRDSGDTHRGLKLCRSGGWITTGGLQNGCRSVKTLWSEDAPPGRCLQDRCSHVHGESAISRACDGPALAARWDLPLCTKGDNLPAEPGGRTTFGDNARQYFALGREAGSAGLQDSRLRGFQRDRSQGNYGKALTKNSFRVRPGTTHTCGPMGSKISVEKVSETTTKNDNMRNRLCARVFWPRRSGRFMNPSASSSGNPVPWTLGGRAAPFPRTDAIPASLSTLEQSLHEPEGRHDRS